MTDQPTNRRTKRGVESLSTQLKNLLPGEKRKQKGEKKNKLGCGPTLSYPTFLCLFDQICQHCDKLCQFVSSLSLDIFVYAVVQTLCLDSNLDTKGKNSATT